MTIYDLHRTNINLNHNIYDVCIIGAGAGGLYLSRRLADRGLKVIILEAGGKVCGDGDSIGIEPDMSQSRYGAVFEGRAFGVGGTTSKWGGQLVPYSDLDLREQDLPDNEIWLHITSVIKKYGDAVERALGLGTQTDYSKLPEKLLGPVHETFKDNDLHAVASLWIPFRQRNFSSLITRRHSKNITIVTHAVASEWKIDKSAEGEAKIDSVKALSMNHNSISLKARKFVVAAGAVESTRILLEIGRLIPNHNIRQKSSLGKYLSDHISCKIAYIESRYNRSAINMFSPHFIRGKLRTLRFIKNEQSNDTPRHYFHFIFNHSNPGFFLAKKLLTAMQSKNIPKIGFQEIFQATAGMANLGYHKIINSRLYIPENSDINLQLDIEQYPDVNNCISLGDRFDRYGRPICVVNWKINENDNARIQNMAEKFISVWPGGKDGIPPLVPKIDLNLSGKPYDVYHPVGACRMGVDKAAVVDMNSQVIGFNNLNVLSTAVFPSAGSANPTFSLLCLAEDMAVRLVQKFKKIQN